MEIFYHFIVQSSVYNLLERNRLWILWIFVCSTAQQSTTEWITPTGEKTKTLPSGYWQHLSPSHPTVHQPTHLFKKSVSLSQQSRILFPWLGESVYDLICCVFKCIESMVAIVVRFIDVWMGRNKLKGCYSAQHYCKWVMSPWLLVLMQLAP